MISSGLLSTRFIYFTDRIECYQTLKEIIFCLLLEFLSGWYVQFNVNENSWDFFRQTLHLPKIILLPTLCVIDKTGYVLAVIKWSNKSNDFQMKNKRLGDHSSPLILIHQHYVAHGLRRINVCTLEYIYASVLSIHHGLYSSLRMRLYLSVTSWNVQLLFRRVYTFTRTPWYLYHKIIFYKSLS